MDIVNVSLSLIELDTTPGLNIGESFQVQIGLKDVRNPNQSQSIFSGGLDVLFDPKVIKVDSISYDPDFSIDRSGTIDPLTGIVNELGATLNGLTAISDPTIATLNVTAIGGGATTLTTRAGDTAATQITVFGLDGDQRSNTSFGKLDLTIKDAAPDLVASVFDAKSDQVLKGETAVDFTLQNLTGGAAGTFSVNFVYSDDSIIGNSDDVIVATRTYNGLAGNATLNDSINLKLPLATLNSRAQIDDPTGKGSGYRSTSSDYLGIIIDPNNQVKETNETNNLNQGKGKDKDDITYFPWDVNGSGSVTSTDAIFIINRLGKSLASDPTLDMRADVNGSGTVTATDAIAVINRLGYLRNDSVIEVSNLPTVTIAVSDANAGETKSGEAANPGAFTLTRTGNTNAALSVAYTVLGTATNGTDYSSLSGTANFVAGSTTTVVTVTPIDDTAFEGNETVILTLTAGSAYTLGSTASGILTIADNDVTSITVTSPNGGNSFQRGQAVTIQWNDNIPDNVRVDLYKNNIFYRNITTSTPSNGSLSWTVPMDVLLGTDYKIRVAKIDGTLIDFSDNNFSITGTPNVDLKGYSLVSGVSAITAGTTQAFNYNVQNAGVDPSGAFRVGFYLSTDTIFTTGDRLLGSETIASLAGGGLNGNLSKSLTLPVAGDSFYNGDKTYYIGMIVDDLNAVAETNESNNSGQTVGDDYAAVTVNGTVSTPFTPTVDLKKFWFWYNYKSGAYSASDTTDAYNGSVIAPADKYFVGQSFYFNSSSNEIGQDGYYYIYQVEDYNDSLTNEAGRVFVHNYQDRDNGSLKEFVPYKYKNGVQPSGTNYLGSEYDYIEDNQSGNSYFGGDYYEADPNQTDISANRWKAEYFNGTNPDSGTAIKVEDTGIDGSQILYLDWGLASPSGVPSDNFSARFTTTRDLKEGLYRITTNSDDGIRVFVGNTGQRVDQWIPKGSGDTYTGYFYVGNGEVPITVEYYEIGGAASVRVEITSVNPDSIHANVDVSTNWNASVFTLNGYTVDGTSTSFYLDDNRKIATVDLGSATRSDGKMGIKFDYGTQAFAEKNNLPHDNYAVRAYTQTKFDGGQYKFRVSGDDAFQLFARKIDGSDTYILSSSSLWTLANGVMESPPITLAAGDYDLHFQYIELSGNANFDLSWEKVGVTPPPSNPDIDIQIFYPEGGLVGANNQDKTWILSKAEQIWETIITSTPFSGGIFKLGVTKDIYNLVNYNPGNGSQFAWKESSVLLPSSVWAVTTSDQITYKAGFNSILTIDGIAGIDYDAWTQFNSGQFGLRSDYQLLKLAVHEIGHALGLDESKYYPTLNGSIMNLDLTEPYITDGLLQKLKDLGYGVNYSAPRTIQF